MKDLFCFSVKCSVDNFLKRLIQAKKRGLSFFIKKFYNELKNIKLCQKIFLAKQPLNSVAIKARNWKLRANNSPMTIESSGFFYKLLIKYV